MNILVKYIVIIIWLAMSALPGIINCQSDTSEEQSIKTVENMDLSELVRQLQIWQEGRGLLAIQKLIKRGSDPDVISELRLLANERNHTVASIYAAYGLYRLGENPDGNFSYILETMTNYGTSYDDSRAAATAFTVLQQLDPIQDRERSSDILELSASSNQWVAEHGVQLLALFPNEPGVLQSIFDAAQGESAGIRKSAAEALGSLAFYNPGFVADPDVLSVLLRLLEDNELAVRATACRKLSLHGRVNESSNALFDIYENDSSVTVRAAALYSLAFVSPHEQIIPVLIDALSSDEDSLVSTAIMGLGYVGPDAKEAVPLLREFLYTLFHMEAEFAIAKIESD